MSKFDLKRFYHFCFQLRIEAKELGLIRMNNLLGTQTYVMDEVAKGLENDKHFFVCLKGRQLGITTITLALDLYWHFKGASTYASKLEAYKKNTTLKDAVVTGLCKIGDHRVALGVMDFNFLGGSMGSVVEFRERIHTCGVVAHSRSNHACSERGVACCQS